MKTKNIVILFFFLFFIPVLHAQTLKEVVRGTLISNPQIQALRINTKAYRLYVDEEQGKQYPKVDFETYFEELNADTNGTDSRKNGSNTQVMLEQTLFDGWLSSSKIDESKKDFQANKFKNIAAIETLALDSIVAYLNVVKNKELTLLSENNLLIHEDYLEVAIESENVSGDTLDRMQVESKIFSANANFSEVKRNALEAKATVEKLYGKELNNDFCRPIIRSNEFEVLDKTIEKALDNNYTILEEIQKIRKQRAIVNQEKSRFLPTIKVKLLREIDDGVDVKDTKKTEDSVRLTLTYNIFNGTQDSAVTQREKLFLKESQKNLDDVVNGIVEEVKINYTKLHTAKKRIEYLKSYLVKNKDILVVYLEQFEGGTRGFIDILNQEAELFRAKTNLIEEQFTYTTSYYELLNLLSKLTPTVLSSDKQICEEITVDIERRKLGGDESTDDAELAAIFEEDEGLVLDENPEASDDKEAKVQSMLNQILQEIYTPNAVNKNINVSNISIEENKKEEEKKPIPTDKQEVMKELIKLKQELEEQAIREEQNLLKQQIAKEAELLTALSESSEQKQLKMVNTQTEELVKNKIENEKIRQEAVRKAKKELLSRKDEPQIVQIQKNKIQNETLRKAALSKANTELETENKKIKTVTVQEEQVLSKKLAQEYREKYKNQTEVGKKEKQLSSLLGDIEENKKRVQIVKQTAVKKAKELQVKTTESDEKKDKKNKVTKKEEEAKENVLEEKREKTSVVVNESTKENLKISSETVKNTPMVNLSLKDEFNRPNSKKYTLAIASIVKKEKPSFIKKLYNLKKNVFVYKSQNNGRVYYKVLYGVYATSKEAKDDIANLHKTLRKYGVFVNKISRHQKLFKKYNPDGEQ